MTAYVAFVPNPNVNFQFTTTLDGQQYNVLVTWSLYGRRWYVNVLDLQGNLVVTEAMVGSPPLYDINLLFGYFTTSRMVFREATGQFEVSP